MLSTGNSPTGHAPLVRAGALVTAVLLLGVEMTAAEPAYIYGMHDPGGEWMMGNNKGWIVWTEAIGTSGSGGANYSSWSNQGYGVIVRLNNGYGSSGTLPYDSQYAAFASRCANFIQNSSGVDYWIIGNECNLPREWPGNVNGDRNKACTKARPGKLTRTKATAVSVPSTVEVRPAMKARRMLSKKAGRKSAA